MNTLEHKDVVREEDVSDDTDFKAFLNTQKEGIAVFHENHYGIDDIVAQPDTNSFVKWLRLNHPDTKIDLPHFDKHLVLHSSEYWLPLVFLASDVVLPIYLNWVSSYLYEKSKGLLKGETLRVRLSAIYEDKESGKTKKFLFEGDSKTLSNTIKKFDLNKFLDLD